MEEAASCTFSIGWPKSFALRCENKRRPSFNVQHNYWGIHNLCIRKAKRFRKTRAEQKKLKKMYDEMTPEFFEQHKELERKMLVYWPCFPTKDLAETREFWLHEAEHGRPSGLSPEEYFFEAIEIAKKVKKAFPFPLKKEDESLPFGRRNLFTADDLRNLVNCKVTFQVEVMKARLVRENRDLYKDLGVEGPGPGPKIMIVQVKFHLDTDFDFLDGQASIANPDPNWDPNQNFLLPMD